MEGGGGGSRKTSIKGNWLKMGLGQVADLKGGLSEKEGVVFFRGGGGDTPMYTMLIRLVQLQCKSTHFEMQT